MPRPSGGKRELRLTENPLRAVFTGLISNSFFFVHEGPFVLIPKIDTVRGQCPRSSAERFHLPPARLD